MNVGSTASPNLNFNQTLQQRCILNYAQGGGCLQGGGLEIPFHVVLGVFEACESCFVMGYVDDFAPFSFKSLNGKHSWVVRSWVLSDDHNDISVVEIISRRCLFQFQSSQPTLAVDSWHMFEQSEGYWFRKHVMNAW